LLSPSLTSPEKSTVKNITTVQHSTHPKVA